MHVTNDLCIFMHITNDCRHTICTAMKVCIILARYSIFMPLLNYQLIKVFPDNGHEDWQY